MICLGKAFVQINVIRACNRPVDIPIFGVIVLIGSRFSTNVTMIVAIDLIAQTSYEAYIACMQYL